MLTIAIDGTASSGKSTLSRRIAEKLGYRYIDSGAMYRAVGWVAIKQGIKLDDAQALSNLARKLEIEIKESGGRSRIIADGKDISKGIRTPKAAAAASKVAIIPAVRTALVAVQRKMAADGGVVMEGRDIGTVVLPDADIKFYLDADIEIRARRRQEEQNEKGVYQDPGDVLAEMTQRDNRDSTREDSPLRIAEDAIRIDTGNRTIENLEREMIAIIKSHSQEPD